MVSRFVEDGPARLAASPEHRARCRQVRESVVARYAAELAEAGFLRRLALRWRMHGEIRRELRRIAPSRESLWFAARQTRGKSSGGESEGCGASERG